MGEDFVTICIISNPVPGFYTKQSLVNDKIFVLILLSVSNHGS